MEHGEKWREETSDREPLRSRRDALLADDRLQGMAFSRAYSLAADEWLRRLFEHAAESTGQQTGRAQRAPWKGLALIAVGGYGRGQLAPASDLDVVLVHERRRDSARIAEAIWYPVWDEGVKLDHSLRTPGEVLSVARKDLRVSLGLLDARLIAGDRSISDPLIQTLRERWRDRAGTWLPELARQAEVRHQANGEVAFLLEPNLKEGKGGLRDIGVIRSIMAARPDILTSDDVSAVNRAEEKLVAARVSLQRVTGRSLDRLALQEQDQVAASLGLADADSLMEGVAEAARRVTWVLDDALHRALPATPAPKHLRNRHDKELSKAPATIGTATKPYDDWFADEAGQSGLAGETPDALLCDPGLALALANFSARSGKPIRHSSLERLASHAEAPAIPWPDTLRSLFVALLLVGRPSIGALESLDQVGILSLLVPEWQAVRNKPQRNAYHRFTIDRHLLETAANAAELGYDIERPDLLVIAALFHDMGKGDLWPGSSSDHVQAGAGAIELIARRMGFSEDDISILETLVRHHLLLADTATRRDLDDPATIDLVASAIGDSSTLDMLAALTEADGLATGPTAWGRWKAGLVTDLCRRTRLRLAGLSAISGAREPAAWQRRIMEAGRLAVRLDPDDPSVLAVTAPDQSGLLAAVTGVLALRGLGVHSADVMGENGMALDVFHLAAETGAPVDVVALEEDLRSVLEHRLSLESMLTERIRVYAPARPAAQPDVPSVDVHLDNETSDLATILEVRAPDTIGLLHQITRALSAADLDVTSARITTVADEALDTFYIRHRDGSKLSSSTVRSTESIIRRVASAWSERAAAAAS